MKPRFTNSRKLPDSGHSQSFATRARLPIRGIGAERIPARGEELQGRRDETTRPREPRKAVRSKPQKMGEAAGGAKRRPVPSAFCCGPQEQLQRSPAGQGAGSLQRCCTPPRMAPPARKRSLQKSSAVPPGVDLSRTQRHVPDQQEGKDCQLSALLYHIPARYRVTKTSPPKLLCPGQLHYLRESYALCSDAYRVPPQRRASSRRTLVIHPAEPTDGEQDAHRTATPRKLQEKSGGRTDRSSSGSRAEADGHTSLHTLPKQSLILIGRTGGNRDELQRSSSAP